MKAILAIAAPTFALLALLHPISVWAASYSYKCPKCGVVMTYDRPGVVKCPKDGSLMSPKW